MASRIASAGESKIIRCAAVVIAAVLNVTRSASAQDASAPVILQWFESTYATQERRAADAFLAGYGSIYLPPTGRADSGNQSVGYDVYDRFDLGKPGNPTLYGTETGLKTAVKALHRAGLSVYADYVINHSGFTDSSSVDGQGNPFTSAGDYPGFVLTHPGTSDGDYHSAFPDGSEPHDIQFRLSGLVDIDHRANLQFIRHPVPGFANNIPAGTIPAYGRLADVPDENNRRFYPDRSLAPILVFDPKTGEQNIAIYPFNNATPIDGDPVPENAMGLLMRHAQWMVQHVGIDGFRIDAAKHVQPFALEYFDRAVYRSSFRTNLDGSQKQVFSFLEVFDGSKSFLQSHIRKDINSNDPGTVGGNRDVLDFPLFFAMRDNLTGNGFANNWHRIRNASQDSHDDSIANNGSQAVAFASSHDDGGVYLSNVAHAFMLMRPGNALVYFNAKDHGTGRDFPKDGRGDALGGFHGQSITTLVSIRNTHGRGNFRERWIDDAFNPDGFSNIYVYEREKSAVVGLNSRLDGGFDQRTGVQTAFAPGTHLIELTGNASDLAVDPNDDIPELVTVNPQGKIDIRIPRNKTGSDEHGRGYVIYGLPTPQGSLILGGVARTIAPQTPTAQTNGAARLAAIDVIEADAFSVQLLTSAVNLLGNTALRDRDADGDAAFLRLDDGIDLNGNGIVDHASPGSVVYGFEEFTLRSPGYSNTDGNGSYTQSVNAAQLAEGFHFLEVRAFRRRGDGGPPVYTPLKKVLYVDRLKPLSSPDSFNAIVSGVNENRRLTVRSTDLTADNVHVFFDLPAALTDQQVLAMVGPGSQASRIDRDLWTRDRNGLTHGNHVATVVTFEMTGNSNVQRFPGFFTSTIFGAGPGDVNFNGSYTPEDVDAFKTFLHSDDTQFNPAADLDADGRIDDDDLFQLGPRLRAVGASPATHQRYNNLLLSPRAGRTRNFAGALDNSEGAALAKSDSGHMIVSGPQSHGPGASIDVAGGRLDLATDAGPTLSLSVQAGAELKLLVPQHLKSIHIPGGSAQASVLYAQDVTITANGALDLGTALILSSDAPAADLDYLEAQIQLARADGQFDGPGLFSSASIDDPFRGLAPFRNLNTDGSPVISSISGFPVPAGAIVVFYALEGDTDFNARIDAEDYDRIDRGYLHRLDGYLNGDLNSDSLINIADYTLIDAAFLSQITLSNSTAIPEPAALSLLVSAMIASSLRRRRVSRAIPTEMSFVQA